MKTFEELYKGFYASIKAYALKRLIDKSLSDDVVQEVFLQALKKFNKTKDNNIYLNREILFKLASNICDKHNKINIMEPSSSDIFEGQLDDE